MDTDKHHCEIWSEARNNRPTERPPVFYVENHNAPCGYAEVALDFEMLVDELLPRLDPHQPGNWVAPILHLARQTIELRLKALLQTILERDASIDGRILGKHNLLAIWNAARDWLNRHGYRMHEDSRLDASCALIDAFHAVDPTGDLFRFAQSRQVRFGKCKSYDRVGVNHQSFPLAFKQSVGLLRHWEAVLFREQMQKEMGWDKDQYFDADDFPRRSHTSSDRGAA